jgi:hypothetical protein
MLDRFATYGVPIIAGLVTAAVLLGPGSERPATGIRVYGSIADGAQRVALRVKGFSHVEGAYAPASLSGVEIELSRGDAVFATWDGNLGDEWVDVLLAMNEPAVGEITLRAASGDEELLSTVIIVAPELAEIRRLPAIVAKGVPHLTFEMPRGTSMFEHPEPVVITARAPTAGMLVGFKSQGCEWGAPLSAKPSEHCDNDGCVRRFQTSLTCRAPGATIAVEARIGDQTNTLEAAIEPQKGVLWLDPSQVSGESRIRATVPVERAYISYYSQYGREWGTSVVMDSSDNASTASFKGLQMLHHEAATVVLSTDPLEPEGSTSTWRQGPHGPHYDHELVLLGDGLPAAVRAEDARRLKARLPAVGLIVAAALFELFYLLLRWRRARDGLEVLADALAEGTGTKRENITRRPPLLWLSLFGFALFLLFTILAIITLLA